ncbi:phosphatidylinositol-specific phospholipase C1-like protein [Olivibacter sp. XZL3]|uniref:phosphatidylinositol-specific phospholipase C1-like protein n=1 Tax=Olivibacter sp. XZL3 TaxID=1735116 RepID=UPI001065E2C2|nr:phosphatidylinositol-specific phospholipase C1-like protein [Olivibacter sp. XZL3]
MKAFVCFAIILATLSGRREIPDSLPINKIQVIGSHNSYKRAIDPALFKVLEQHGADRMKGLDYSHIPIIDQLEMGLGNLEIDVYRDEKGGRYAHPKGLDLAPNQEPYDPDGEMLRSGYKVLHVPDYDFRTDSYTLESLLKKLRVWSEEHPDHYPVFITLEAKGGDSSGPGMAATEALTVQAFDELDRCIEEYLGREHLITPDDVRGHYSTLEEAVLAGNWPKVQEAKGKYLFVLDDKDRKRATYMEGRPSLKGRILFVNADPGTPEAAILIRNNAKLPEIKTLVQQGYIIRTRADSDTKEARANDRSNFEAACNAGAQIITTDYYLKSTHFDSDYRVHFEGEKYIRVNPVFVADK